MIEDDLDTSWMTPEDWRKNKFDAAVHEAGHYVIAKKLGLETVDVRIIPDPNGLTIGKTIWVHRFASANRRKRYGKIGTGGHKGGAEHWSILIASIVTTLAGPYTGMILLRHRVAGLVQWDGAHAGDKRNLDALVFQSCLSKRQMNLLRSFTRRMIRRHRAEIERVAHMLAQNLPVDSR